MASPITRANQRGLQKWGVVIHSGYGNITDLSHFCIIAAKLSWDDCLASLLLQKKISTVRGTYSQGMKVQIKPFQSKEHIAQVTKLWHNLLPGYKVPEDRLQNLLDNVRGHHYVACVPTNGSSPIPKIDSPTTREDIVGFAATHFDESEFASSESKGYISVVLVESKHQNQGVGTELLKVACSILLRTYACNTITIGSVFPRFWPGLPTDIPSKDQDFFRHFFEKDDRLQLSEDTLCRDLCLHLENYSSPEFVISRAAQAGIRVSPLSGDGFAECMSKQRANFQNDGWVAAYEELGAQGMFRQIMVAYDSIGKQVGWTLMVEPNLAIWNMLAFPCLLGERTGLIACVGVDKNARECGVGRVLVNSAVEDLKNRGMQHVFVDWVTLEGWYEKLGFETWREYRTLVWKLKNGGPEDV